jgi:hypothetical protein
MRAETERVEVSPIPPITDPLGRSWQQPARERILIDDTHALMLQAEFERLAEYSATMPTGVYPGKMWKRHDGVYDPVFLAAGGVPTWKLCWFGFSEKGPGFCSIHHREILLVDGGPNGTL